jgi:predicted protein tyrosine phosphatase
MQIAISSKLQFDTFMKKRFIDDVIVNTLEDTFFISINDSCGTNEVPYFKDSKNVKVLFFDDVEVDLHIPIVGTNEVKTAKAFTVEQAKELLQFIDTHKHKSLCMIHCAAGISRSGAVGTFLNDYLRQDWHEFKRQNPFIHPNPHVLRVLKSLV